MTTSPSSNGSSPLGAKVADGGRTPVAQLVEQRIPNPQVAGSIPSRRVEDESEGGFGIYKFGRGYWVRMLTAIALGVLVLSTAAWAWKQLEAWTPPSKGWTLSLSQPQGGASAGQTVDLTRSENDRDVKVASAVVESYATEGKGAATMVVNKVVVEPGQNMLDVRKAVVAGAPGASPALSAAVSNRLSIPSFERVYVQAGVAGIIVLVGGFLTFKFVGRSPKSVDFLIATDEEMRKVNWSTRKIILNSTYVVIGATFLIAAYIFLFDLGLKAAIFTPIVNAK